MARVKGGLNAKKRHNRTLKLAKGYRGARSKQYRVAKQSVMRAPFSVSCTHPFADALPSPFTYLLAYTIVSNQSIYFENFLCFHQVSS